MIRPVFAVLGAGSWGTALAVHVAHHAYATTLWSHRAEDIALMKKKRENTRYLPGISFPTSLALEDSLEKTVEEANVILLAVPSHAIENLLIRLKPLLKASHILLLASKGLTAEGELLSDCLTQLLPKTQYALLSGPSFAAEVAKQLPTAIIIASQNKTCAHNLAMALSKNLFRVYTSHDLIGVQIGGAVKNILAVAVGISDGMGFGANARAALITRGLREMKQLALAAGGEAKTIMGLSGLGDLVLTCTDNQSRNRRLGLAIGQGKTIAQAQQEIGQVTESIHTAMLIQKMIKRYAIEMPIVEQIYHVLHHERAPKEALKNLLSRQLKAE